VAVHANSEYNTQLLEEIMLPQRITNLEALDNFINYTVPITSYFYTKIYMSKCSCWNCKSSMC